MHEIVHEIVMVNLGERSYRIFIGRDILDNIPYILRDRLYGRRVIFITNPIIGSLYIEGLLTVFRENNYECDSINIPDGEEYKTLEEADKIYTKLLELRCDRKTLLVALGGGVVGDLTGFVASTYMRGVGFVQIPTSLLAQVDSSIGGKTGVNHKLAKNMIGSFYQPLGVVIDINTLNTLPIEEFRAGMAEVIKYGIIADKVLFEYIEQHLDEIMRKSPVHLQFIIKRSCEIKALIVERDEKESGYRAILNFGHTAGHALEGVTNYKRYRHGEAVSIGMVYASVISNLLGRCDKGLIERIKDILKRVGLPITTDFSLERDFFEIMLRDKKFQNGSLRFVLIDGDIGCVRIHNNIDKKILEQANYNFLEGCLL